jgi:hypothetical protein
MVLVMARKDAGPFERQQKTLRESLKTTIKAKGPSQKQAKWQPKNGSTYSFLG